jgi:hypothetical protein
MWIVMMLDEGYTPPKQKIIDVVDTYPQLLKYIKKLYEQQPRLRLRQTPFEAIPLKEEFIVGVDNFLKFIVVRAEFVSL